MLTSTSGPGDYFSPLTIFSGRAGSFHASSASFRLFGAIQRPIPGGQEPASSPSRAMKSLGNSSQVETSSIWWVQSGPLVAGFIPYVGGCRGPGLQSPCRFAKPHSEARSTHRFPAFRFPPGEASRPPPVADHDSSLGLGSDEGVTSDRVGDRCCGALVPGLAPYRAAIGRQLRVATAREMPGRDANWSLCDPNASRPHPGGEGRDAKWSSGSERRVGAAQLEVAQAACPDRPRRVVSAPGLDRPGATATR